MSRGYYGYLVRALNEFASLTAQCTAREISRPMPVRAKTTTENRARQIRQKKTRSTADRRRPR